MSYKVSLNYPEERKKQRKMFFWWSIMYIIMGSTLIFSDERFYMGLSYLILGISSVILVFFWKISNDNYFIEFNEKGIKYKRYKKKLLNIPWQTIEKIEEKPTEFLIYLNNSQMEKIELENVNYKEIREIKERLKEFAEERNIIYD